jgi:DNA-binding transcriptional ArsR family regulator
LTRVNYIVYSRAMKYEDALDDVLGNKLKLRILRLFCTSGGEYTGREIAKLAGYSQTYTIKALGDLEANGLLYRRDVARAHLYSLNEEHMLVKELKKLFDLERSALARVAKDFKEELGDSLEGIIIFGSVARREERPDSDIDMILILKDGSKPVVESKISSVSNATAAASGSPVSAFLATETELGRLQGKEDKRGMWAEVFGEEPVIFVDFERRNPRLRHIEAGKHLPRFEKKHQPRASRK